MIVGEKVNTKHLYMGRSPPSGARRRAPLGYSAVVDTNPEFPPRDRFLHPPAFYPAYRSSVLRSPRKSLVPLRQTLTEITGPRLSLGSIAAGESDLLSNAGTGRAPIGERICVHGTIKDQHGRLVSGIGIEIWQANAAGRYRHSADQGIAPLDPDFIGAGRTCTGLDGHYAFLTVRPGAYPWPNGKNSWRPSHVHFSLVGVSASSRLVTQMYFEGDPLIAHCPIANSIPDVDALDRLVARFDLDSAKPFDHLAYRFDIVLRGRNETPHREESK